MRQFVAACLMSLFVIVNPIHAKDITIKLHLVSITASKTSENQGDELYFDVSVFPSHKLPSGNRIPMKPLHWPSRAMPLVKNLSLWDGVLKPNQATTLIVSLMEMDAPPWDTDDLIGSVRIRVKNVKGQLESSWSMPNRVDAPIAIETKEGWREKFKLFGEYSNYELVLELDEK